MPRERVIRSEIGSTLIHEVGRQGSIPLDLANSLRPILQGMQRGDGSQSLTWTLWERWISEILTDFWSVARLGIDATLGLICVVSLPRAFVFRFDLEGPHPVPWIRVKFSCALPAIMPELLAYMADQQPR